MGCRKLEDKMKFVSSLILMMVLVPAHAGQEFADGGPEESVSQSKIGQSTVRCHELSNDDKRKELPMLAEIARRWHFPETSFLEGFLNDQQKEILKSLPPKVARDTNQLLIFPYESDSESLIASLRGGSTDKEARFHAIKEYANIKDGVLTGNVFDKSTGQVRHAVCLRWSADIAQIVAMEAFACSHSSGLIKKMPRKDGLGFFNGGLLSRNPLQTLTC
jgi:hypothetical protein